MIKEEDRNTFFKHFITITGSKPQAAGCQNIISSSLAMPSVVENSDNVIVFEPRAWVPCNLIAKSPIAG